MPDIPNKNIPPFLNPNPGNLSNSEKLEVIVNFNGDLLKIENDLGVEVEDLGNGFAIVTLKAGQIPSLYGYKEIEYIELPKTLTLALNQSLRAACVTSVQNSTGYNLTGKDVLIAVLDSGIDYTHPDFRNEDGTSRILYIWDQTGNGNPPPGFHQGAEYTNDQINMALKSPQPFEVVPSSDLIGHGTAVAGIAAGNGRASNGNEKGTAPEASLIVVKLGHKGNESFSTTTEIMRALKYAIDKAEALGMPIAVNISFGTNNGSHDGDSLFETYVNLMAQEWKTVIVAATGNEGAARHHFARKINQSQTIDINFAIGDQLSSLYLTFWKNFADVFTLELILPNGLSTGVFEAAQQLITRDIGGASIQVAYGQPTHYNEAQEIFFLITQKNSAIPQGIWQLKVNGINIVDGRFNIWLPTLEEVGSQTAFTEPSADATFTLPSTVKNVISVGGYNSDINTTATFSGRGFVNNNIYEKPDLTAPAVGIMSARPGGGYDSFTGTSMAAPFVTGASALMMQWGIVLNHDPFLYGQRVKAFLKKGAARSLAIVYPNPIWGYGTLCLKNSIDYLNDII